MGIYWGGGGGGGGGGAAFAPKMIKVQYTNNKYTIWFHKIDQN